MCSFHTRLLVVVHLFDSRVLHLRMTSTNASDMDQSSSLPDTATAGLDPDRLFRTIHAFNRDPRASPATFLTDVGGFFALFSVASLIEDDITLRMLLASIAKAVSGLHAGGQLDAQQMMPYVLSGLSSGSRLELRLFVVQQLQSLLPVFAPSLATQQSPLRDALLSVFTQQEAADAEDDDSLTLLAPVTNLLLSFTRLSPSNQHLFFSPTVSQPLLTAATTNDTVLLRVLSFYIDVACVSVEAYDEFVSSSLLDRLLYQLSRQSHDPLSQLNAVELVIKLVQSSAGPVPAALSTAVMTALYDCMGASTGRPAFLSVATLQTAEALAMKQATGDWWRDERLVALLTTSVDSDDDSVVLQAIVTLCVVSALSLDSLLLYLPLCQRTLPSALSSSAELVQLSALHGLAKLFAPTASATPHPSSTAATAASTAATPAGTEQAVLSLKEELFASLSPSPARSTVDVLHAILTTPFEAHRYAAYDFLTSVASLPSVTLLRAVTAPGWVEWLLDRRTEVELAGMRKKWAVLRAVSGNAVARGSGSGSGSGRGSGGVQAAVMQQVDEYVRQGPVYVSREAAVMAPVTQGSDG